MSEYLSPPDIADSFRDLDGRISDIVLGPTPPWLFPTLENGWVNFGGAFGTVSYMRDGVGIIRLRAMIKSGTLGKAAFTLPVGFRPGIHAVYASYSNTGAARVDVFPTGEVVPEAGGTEFITLTGISFIGEK